MLQFHFGSIPFVEYGSVSAFARMTRFGKAPGMRNMATFRQPRRNAPHADPDVLRVRVHRRAPGVRLGAKGSQHRQLGDHQRAPLLRRRRAHARCRKLGDHDQLRLRAGLHQPSVHRSLRRRQEIRRLQLRGDAADGPVRRSAPLADRRAAHRDHDESRTQGRGAASGRHLILARLEAVLRIERAYRSTTTHRSGAASIRSRSSSRTSSARSSCATSTRLVSTSPGTGTTTSSRTSTPINHAQQIGIYLYRATQWWDAVAGVSPPEREWLEKKYPGWNDTYGTDLGRHHREHPGRTHRAHRAEDPADDVQYERARAYRHRRGKKWDVKGSTSTSMAAAITSAPSSTSGSSSWSPGATRGTSASSIASSPE